METSYSGNSFFFILFRPDESYLRAGNTISTIEDEMVHNTEGGEETAAGQETETGEREAEQEKSR